MESRTNTRSICIKEILNSTTNLPIIKTDTFFSELSQSTLENINSDHLILEIYNHIISLRMLIDSQHNIHSTLFTSSDKKQVYVRYCEMGVMLEPQEKKIAIYNYLRIFYAYLLAAIVISKINHFDNINFCKGINHIKKITTDAFYENLPLDNDEAMFRYLSEGKGYLIKLMHVYCDYLDHISLNYMIDQVKDWVALDEPSIPVCTVIKMNENYNNNFIIILDNPCSQLLTEQSHSFENLSSQDWFNELSSFQKKLVIYYKDKILTGLSVIPSRLRNVIPLNKNAFEETVWVAKSADEIELINTCYHSGTVAYLSHKDETIATNMTRLNLLQQKSVCQADAIVMICLNSEKADTFLSWYEWLNSREFIPDDSEIIKLTKNAANQLANENIFYSKLCLNGFRIIEYNDYWGIDKIIAIVKENLSKINSTLVVQINQLITMLINLQKQVTIIDYAVKGLDIIHLLTQIATLNNQLVDSHLEVQLKRVAIWFGCASGENRTGITFNHNIGSSVRDYFPTTSISDTHNTIAQTQHLHVMTGYQGNTFGTDGIRSKSSGALKDYHPGRWLITKTSDIRSIPAYDASYNAMIKRLDEAVKKSELNEKFKYLIPLVKMYLVFLKNNDSDIVLLPEQTKNLYMDLTYPLEEILLTKYDSVISNNFSLIQNIQDKLLDLLATNKNKDENLITLKNLQMKIINALTNLNQSIPTGQLTNYGLFKKDEALKILPTQSLSKSDFTH